MSKKGRRGRSNRRTSVAAPGGVATGQAAVVEAERVADVAPPAEPAVEPAPEPMPPPALHAEAPDASEAPAEQAAEAAAPPQVAAAADEADEARYEGVPRDDSSYPPVDLDNHFF